MRKFMRGLLAICLLVALSIGMNIPAWAADNTPQAPQTFDASGCDMDGFFLNQAPGQYYFAENDPSTTADDVELPKGFTVAGCVSSYRVKSYYSNIMEPVVPGPVYDLSFNTAITGVEAPNIVTFEVVPGSCDEISTKMEVRFWIENVHDETLRYLSSVILATWRRGDNRIPGYLEVGRVFDGETAAMGSLFIWSGSHEVSVSFSGQPLVSMPQDVVVPQCGDVLPPKIGGNTSAQPRGNLKVMHKQHKVVAKGINRKVNTKTTFKLVVKRASGKKLKRPFTVGPNQVGKEVFKQTRPGDRYRLTATFMKNGSTTQLVVAKVRR